MEEESCERTSSFLHGADLLYEQSNGKPPDGRASSAGEVGGAPASAWDVFPGQGCAAWVFSWQQGCNAHLAGVRGARPCQPAACPPCCMLVWAANTLVSTAASTSEIQGTVVVLRAPFETLQCHCKRLEERCKHPQEHHCKCLQWHCKPQNTVANPGAPL